MKILKTFCLALFFFASSHLPSEELASGEELASFFSPDPVETPPPAPMQSSPDGGYTINYNTVAIVEYIRFASKICNINFIFNEQDLDFTVTVVSDAPITPENVMATLLQTLRIHGLELLEQDGNLIIHTAGDVKQIARLVTETGQGKNAPIVTRIFRINNAKADSIAAIVRPMISSTSILETSPETRQLILTDITANVDKVAELIAILDSPHNPLEMKSYQPVYNSPQTLVDLGHQILAPIVQGQPFTLVPQPLANSIFIVSTPDLVGQALAALQALDVPPKPEVVEQRRLRGENIFVYQPINRTGDDLLISLMDIASNLKKTGIPEGDLIDTIHSARVVRETSSILFVGSKETIVKLKEFLGALDSSGKEGSIKNSFFVYKPQNKTASEIEQALHEMAGNLKGAKGVDETFIDMLLSAKINHATHTLVFAGDEAHFAQIKSLLSTIDISNGKKTGGDKVFFLYTVQASSKDRAETYLNQLAGSLDRKSEAPLIDAIRSMKWISASQSFMFQGTEPAIARLKEILQAFDKNPSAGKTGYYIYKLQSATTEAMEEDLDLLAKNFKATGAADSQVLEVLEKIRYVKETSSLLLTGDPAAIEEVKKLIAEYDHPSVSNEPVSTDFYMYKPQHRSASEIEKSLHEVAASLKKADLADPSLLKAISSAKYVSTTNSIIFTGSAETLQKIQSLLKSVDVPPHIHAAIQQVGKTTFLLYKLKHAGGPQILGSLKTMEGDLKKSGNADKDFLSALSTMKYVKETNSLLFTGTEEALKQVEALVATFDVTSLAGPTQAERAAIPVSSNFFLYKPRSIPGPELEKLMQDFAENLKLSGLSDPELFNAILSMRWVEKTQSLIFAGTTKSLDQVKELLNEFDIPNNLLAGANESTMQAIDNTNFLVYKLQFHKGDEIQGVLRQIAKDLASSNAPVNSNLLNAINSIQWLDVTNSLLCSGDQETLTRLKELIKNLDIPLKQVFIEILVIETSLTNALNFGLEWGANYNFNNKFGASTYNTTPPLNVQTPFPDTFITNLGKLTPPATPTPIGNIPANAGFDLGVIGEVIKHNGQTFLTLGSLLTALQSDTETTIVNTPKILAQDGRTSTFFSGSNIPFTGSFVNNTQSGATIQTSNLEYRDIGLNLTITPVLGNSDIVTLDISLDREQTATDITQSQLNFSAQTANGIVTSKTTMQTTVHVPDRNFLILSGFVNNSNTKQKAGIPCLGGLPMIGAAFSQANDTIACQNIVIFLRPYILNSLDDMRRVTSEQEDFFRDQSATPFLEHNFGEAIELIKTIDDE